MLDLIAFPVCGSCRKFCDNSFALASQFLPQRIVHVFANSFNITIK